MVLLARRWPGGTQARREKEEIPLFKVRPAARASTKGERRAGADLHTGVAWRLPVRCALFEKQNRSLLEPIAVNKKALHSFSVYSSVSR